MNRSGTAEIKQPAQHPWKEDQVQTWRWILVRLFPSYLELDDSTGRRQSQERDGCHRVD